MTAVLRGLAVLPVLLLAACSQTGDLGREKTGVLQTQILPAYEKSLDRMAGQPVSDLAVTDQEKTMHDRMWRFYSLPPQGELLLRDSRILKRTALANPKIVGTNTNRYYAYLTDENYTSTQGIYNRVASDIQADIQSLPGVYAAICDVEQNDRRRRVALQTFSALSADARQQVALRLAENKQTISLFAKVLDFRYRSYSMAMTHLLAERPDPIARTIDTDLSDLARLITVTQRDGYCDDGKPGANQPVLADDRPITLGG